MWISRLSDKTGSLGTIVAAMGCSMCFPAIASLGSAIGLGFLTNYEGLLLNTLLPLFALIALLANLYTGLRQHQWLRMTVGITGPLMVLATLYLFWSDSWSTDLFYAGLILMLGVSAWDLLSPGRHQCINKNIRQTGEKSS